MGYGLTDGLFQGQFVVLIATFWFRDMQAAIDKGLKRQQIAPQHTRLDVNKKADRKAPFLLRD